MKKKRIVFAVVLLVVLMVTLTGCIPGDGSYTVGSPAGFWWGIWHGMIVWISFIIGLFTGGDRTIYESINTGWPYNLGFLIGAGAQFGSITGGLVRVNINTRRRKRD